MNVNTAMSLLALRVEDADKVIFTDDLKLKTLINGEMKLCQMIRNEYLTELQNIAESKTATDGVLALSTSDSDTCVDVNGVLRGIEGIIKVKIHGGLFATEISMKDLKKTENIFLAGSAQNPVYYLYNNTIYINAGVTSPVIDVFYVKMPSPLLYKFAYTYAAPTFSGDTGQGLSGVSDYYNGAVIYCVEEKTYHIVTDYTGLRVFSLTPGYSGIGTGTFYFLTHAFDLQKLENVNFELNSSLHEIIVTLAESECWSMDNKIERRKSALDSAFNEINILNERYTKAEGLGTRGRS